MTDNRIFITDEDGNEKEMNVLFTFEMDEKKYAILFETGKEDDLYAFTYDEDGNIYAVEDEEELSTIEEVVSAFEEDSL